MIMVKSKKILSDADKQKRPRSKKHKTTLLFDDKARVDYLTGFRKRKNERRKKAQEEIVKKYKDEKKRIKEERREKMLTGVISKKCQALPDMEEIKEPTTYELPSHTVTVTDVTDMDFVGSSGLMLGTNTEAISGPEAASEGNQVPVTENIDNEKRQKLNKTFKKRNRNLSNKVAQKQRAKHSGGFKGKKRKDV